MDQVQGFSGVDFTDDSDADLLAYMAMQSEDHETAKAAWGEFFFRHREYLLGTMQQRGFASRVGGEGKLEELIQDVFVKIWRKPGAFRGCDETDTDATERIVRTWLARIAERVCNDYFRGNRHELGSTGSLEEKGEVQAPEQLGEQCERSAVHLLALEAYNTVLDDRDREILIAVADHLLPGEQFQRMPNGVARRLAERQGTTTAGVRMRRKRAREKIKKYIEDHQKGARS